MTSGYSAWRALGAYLVISVVAGCGEVRIMQQSEDGHWLQPRAAAGLVADPRSPIPDVPMPVGFVPVPSKCRAGATSTARNVVHVYEGRATMRDAVTFYRSQPPQHDWQFLGEQAMGSEVMMWYERGPERLSVQLSRSGGTVRATVGIADGWASFPGAVPGAGTVPGSTLGAASVNNSAWLKP